MIRRFPVAVATGLIVLTGWVHGLWTDRWSLSNEPAISAARLDTVPLEVGTWRMRPLPPLSPQDLAIGEIKGYLSRAAEDQRTRETVELLIVCGRPGPISVHTPDICFGGAGYELLEQSKKPVSQGLKAPAEFWVGQFRKKGTPPTFVEIYWTWSSNGAWLAPDDPRLRFAGQPRLYKLYIIRSLAGPGREGNSSPVKELVTALMPELDKRLFSSAH
jgi:Protein of unknown function (DUF3485)